jgi:adenosine deaminase
VTTLIELASERNVILPPEFLLHEEEKTSTTTSNKLDGEVDDYDEVLFLNMKPRSLKDCFAIFDILPQCVNDLPSLRRIMREMLEDASLDNVIYLEVRTGPKILLIDHHQQQQQQQEQYCTKKEYVQAILDVMQDFETSDRSRYDEAVTSMNNNNDCNIRLPMIPRLLISIDRSGTIEQAMENVQLAIEMSQSSKYIVGVELGGNPTRNNFTMFVPVFATARKAGLPISIHCGEVPMAEDDETTKNHNEHVAYQEAMSIIQFKPERLGHALLLSNSLMEQLMKDPIHIECCPTSNVMTLGLTTTNELAAGRRGNLLDGIKHHPQLRQWIQHQYPISINTDDSGIFSTTLTKEYILVMQGYNLSESDLTRIIVNSIQHIFDPSEEIKKWLITMVLDMFERLMGRPLDKLNT